MSEKITTFNLDDLKELLCGIISRANSTKDGRILHSVLISSEVNGNIFYPSFREELAQKILYAKVIEDLPGFSIFQSIDIPTEQVFGYQLQFFLTPKPTYASDGDYSPGIFLGLGYNGDGSDTRNVMYDPRFGFESVVQSSIIKRGFEPAIIEPQVNVNLFCYWIQEMFEDETIHELDYFWVEYLLFGKCNAIREAALKAEKPKTSLSKVA